MGQDRGVGREGEGDEQGEGRGGEEEGEERNSKGEGVKGEGERGGEGEGEEQSWTGGPDRRTRHEDSDRAHAWGAYPACAALSSRGALADAYVKQS